MFLQVPRFKLAYISTFIAPPCGSEILVMLCETCELDTHQGNQGPINLPFCISVLEPDCGVLEPALSVKNSQSMVGIELHTLTLHSLSNTQPLSILF